MDQQSSVLIWRDAIGCEPAVCDNFLMTLKGNWYTEYIGLGEIDLSLRNSGTLRGGPPPSPPHPNNCKSSKLGYISPSLTLFLTQSFSLYQLFCPNLPPPFCMSVLNTHYKKNIIGSDTASMLRSRPIWNLRQCYIRHVCSRQRFSLNGGSVPLYVGSVSTMRDPFPIIGSALY